MRCNSLNQEKNDESYKNNKFNNFDRSINADQVSASCSDKSYQITKQEISSALKTIYETEVKPVEVGSIKSRTKGALILIYIGIVMIVGALSFKFISQGTTEIITSLILFIFAISIGFILSTSNIRQIYNSMSKFRDSRTIAYRKVFINTPIRNQAIVYATLFSLILLGSQTVNLFYLINLETTIESNEEIDPITIKMGSIFIENVVLGETYKDSTGQFYRYITVQINNSINYYGSDLVLDIESYFAGRLFDQLNITLDDPTDETRIESIKIHDPDDTSINTYLRLTTPGNEKELDSIVRRSIDDIYITSAQGKVSKTGIAFKTIEIEVEVYNLGPARAQDVVGIVVYKPGISEFTSPIYYDSAKNNNTIKHNGFWEVKFNIDNLLEVPEFFVVMNIDENTEDQADVESN